MRARASIKENELKIGTMFIILQEIETMVGAQSRERDHWLLVGRSTKKV